MDILVGFILGVFSGLVANQLSPRFSKWSDKMMGRISNALNPDRFDLTATWEHTYQEPDPTNPSVMRKMTEKIRLSHLGNTVSGHGETTDKRIFVYDLRVRHNMIHGSYEKQGEQGNITGHGMIQLVLALDRLSMQGHATWLDSDTQKIESTSIYLKKVS